MSKKLAIDELKYVQNEVKLKGKSLGVSYALTLLFGFIGIHLGYLERTKSAVIRALLTVSTVAAFYPVRSAVNTLESEGLSSQLQQQSSTMFVVFSGMILANLLWTMYDLVVLPSMVKEVNSKIEAKMTTKTIQARYVAEDIRKDDVSEVLIQEISERLSSKIEDHIEKQTAIINDRFSLIDKDLMQKREDTIDLIENISSNLKELERLTIELDDEVENVKESSAKDIELIKINIQDELRESRANLENTRLQVDKKLNHKIITERNEHIDRFKSELENTFTMDTEDPDDYDDFEEIDYDSDFHAITDDNVLKNNPNDFDVNIIDVDPEPVISSDVEVTKDESIGTVKETSKDKESTNDKNALKVKEVMKIYELTDEEKAIKIEEIIEEEPEISSEYLEKLVKDLNSIDIDEDEIETMDRLFARGSCNVEVMENIFASKSGEALEDLSPVVGGHLSVDKAISKGKGEAIVKGYIVGYMSPDKQSFVFDDFNGDMNVVISDSSKERNTNRMIIVQLSWDSKLRESIGLLSNPGNLGKEIVVSGQLSRYFKELGIKDVTSIQIVER